MTFEELVKDRGITMTKKFKKSTYEGIGKVRFDHYTITLKDKDDYSMKIPYFQGEGIKEVILKDVLHCLITDYFSYDHLEEMYGIDLYNCDETSKEYKDYLKAKAQIEKVNPQLEILLEDVEAFEESLRDY